MSSLLRLDPSPSKVFSWIEYDPDALCLRDEATGYTRRPSGPLLRVRYRTTGAEWEFWPVSEAEARAVMNPGAVHDYSIGRAFGSVIKAHKSGRLVNTGERRETVKQKEIQARRWLA